MDVHRKIALLAALAGIAFPAGAGTAWRCTDADGRTWYSQVQPAGMQCRPAAPLPPDPAAEAPPVQDYAGEIERARALDAQQREAQERERVARQARCTEAQRRQALLDTFGARVYWEGSGRTSGAMTEEQYRAERQQVASDVARNCP